MNYKSNQLLWLSIVLITAILLVPFDMVSQKSSQKESDNFIYAKTILSKMSNYLASADQMSFTASMSEDEVYLEDLFIQTEFTSEIVFKRPNKIYANMTSADSHKRFWFNGEKVTLLTDQANLYASADVKGDIDKMIDMIGNKFGVSLPLVGLAFSNPYKTLIENVSNGYYLGFQEINGVKCHHLLFVEDDLQWQIWIEVGKTLVPRKYVVTYTKEDGFPKFTALINNWSFNGYAPNELFNFTPRERDEQIEFLIIND